MIFCMHRYYILCNNKKMCITKTTDTAAVNRQVSQLLRSRKREAMADFRNDLAIHCCKADRTSLAGLPAKLWLSKYKYIYLYTYTFLFAPYYIGPIIGISTTSNLNAASKTHSFVCEQTHMLKIMLNWNEHAAPSASVCNAKTFVQRLSCATVVWMGYEGTFRHFIKRVASATFWKILFAWRWLCVAAIFLSPTFRTSLL